MKKLLITFGILIVGVFLFTFKNNDGTPLLSYSPCDSPLTYRLGTIDPRFNLSAAEAKARVDEAAALWNGAWKQPIFVYDPKGEIKISLDYDERQMLSSQINELQSNLDHDKTSLDPQVNAYKERSLQFEKDMAELNAQIEYWNSRGGAPEPEFNQLKEKQAALREEAEKLNTQAAALNQSTKAYNTQIRALNQTVNQLDKTLTTKPEEGIYNPNDQTISIYFNNSKEELMHTMAHELGHARGLDHTRDPQSIMYVSSTKTTTLSQEDVAALSAVCEKRALTELYWNKYVDFVRAFREVVLRMMARS